MITVSMLIGLPGSGKSTWAKKKTKEPKTVRINRDSLYTMLAGEYRYDLTLSEMVESIILSTVRNALALGFNLIIDETHITKKRRAHTHDMVTAFGHDVKIVYVHFTETERNLEYRMRNDRGQDRDKWQSVINGMKADFESFEGEDFDELIEVMIP